MKTRKVIWILFAFLACRSDVMVEGTLSFEEPTHFPAKHYNFGTTAYNKQIVALGRLLFYDPILSIDSSVSCASCHIQQNAFSDPGKTLSIGVNGKLGVRHAPALFNLAWFPSFMWDGGINHIEIMPVAPIADTAEMNETIGNVVRKLNRHKYYSGAFKKIFEADSVNDRFMLVALAQFMSTIISSNSFYDKVYKKEAKFSVEQLQGYAIFKTYCSTCHKEPLLTDFSFRSNGLAPLGTDTGRARITQNLDDKYKFKVPSLRNIALTAPYMHDGRFVDLDAVIQHYLNDSYLRPYVDSALMSKISLSESEIIALKSFLNCLTDTSFINSPILSKPDFSIFNQ